MWNGMEKRLNLMKLKFVWYLNVSGTVDSSVVRMVIGLAKWVLGRIFGTGEREAERYVTGIVCWQQIVLGGLDRGWEGKGKEWGNCETFVERMRWWIEGNAIYSSIVIIIYLIPAKITFGCLKKHKPSPRMNTIILIYVPEHAPQAQGTCGFKCF